MQPAFLISFLASPARFERAAFRLGGERSILLSYGDKLLFRPFPAEGPPGFFILHRSVPFVNERSFLCGETRIKRRRAISPFLTFQKVLY